MDTFSRSQLRELLDHDKTRCLSLFMPTTRGAGQEDKKRWKNLVHEAEQRLTAGGSRTTEATGLLRPAHELLENVPFWLNVSKGLAVFLAPELFRTYRLPMTFDEQLIVADRFHIKPLLPLLATDSRFYILALSQKNVRLLEANRQTSEEVPLSGVPRSLDEALQYDDIEVSRTVHTHPAPSGKAGAREAISHGHGVGIESAKEGLLEYCRKVDHGIQRLLQAEHAPLVLAGAEPLLSIYRQATSYPHVFAEAVEGHPDRLNLSELHARSWSLVEPHIRDEQEKAASLYKQLAGTGRATNDVSQILAAANQGQIQYLFVDLSGEQWGRFEPEGQKVEIHETAQPGDEDLSNLAAVWTLSHRGSVFTVPSAMAPANTPLAAIFWLPLGERSSKRTIS